MRCREVKSRIDDLLHKRMDSLDAETMSHIKHCSMCCAEYNAVNSVTESIESRKLDYSENIPEFDHIKRQAIARINSTTPTRGSISKPSFALSTVAAVVVIAFLTFFPFRYDHTVGYEVAIAGVDCGAMECDNVICDILYNIGLEDADVDFIGCNPTCSLTVIDLKTREEAELVIAALNEVSDRTITSNVVPIRATHEATLLDKANEKLLK
ncbi:MAG: hypothetical protein R3F48_10595 [Candidatus Zixiibacteriota bacterium]